MDPDVANPQDGWAASNEGCTYILPQLWLSQSQCLRELWQYDHPSSSLTYAAGWSTENAVRGSARQRWSVYNEEMPAPAGMTEQAWVTLPH